MNLITVQYHTEVHYFSVHTVLVVIFLPHRGLVVDMMGVVVQGMVSLEEGVGTVWLVLVVWSQEEGDRLTGAPAGALSWAELTDRVSPQHIHY